MTVLLDNEIASDVVVSRRDLKCIVSSVYERKERRKGEKLFQVYDLQRTQREVSMIV
jgi:hypothetical protein